MAYVCCHSNDNCTSSAAGGFVWVTWVSDQTGPVTTTDAIWNTWTTASSAAATTSATATNFIWRTWIATDQVEWIEQSQRAEVDQQRIAEQQAQRILAEQEAAEQRKVAEEKANELLRAHLSEKQKAALDKHGWFLVEGGKSKKTYRINGKGYAGNIHELDKKGKEVARYCVHAEHTIPLGDQLLTQCLSLLYDEDHIISKANKTALVAA